MKERLFITSHTGEVKTQDLIPVGNYLKIFPHLSLKAAAELVDVASLSNMHRFCDHVYVSIQVYEHVEEYLIWNFLQVQDPEAPAEAAEFPVEQRP